MKKKKTIKNQVRKWQQSVKDYLQDRSCIVRSWFRFLDLDKQSEKVKENERKRTNMETEPLLNLIFLEKIINRITRFLPCTDGIVEEEAVEMNKIKRIQKASFVIVIFISVSNILSVFRFLDWVE